MSVQEFCLEPRDDTIEGRSSLEQCDVNVQLMSMMSGSSRGSGVQKINSITRVDVQHVLIITTYYPYVH